MKARDLLDLARARGVTIATAESCTGGLIAGAITDVPGSSDIFDRGFVTYSNRAKIDMLGVPEDLIARHGAVSREVAAAMAEGALRTAQTDMAVSVTGVAGPGASDRKPEGLVWFGLASSAAPTRTEMKRFGAIGRSGVRERTVAHALDMMIDALSKTD